MCVSKCSAHLPVGASRKGKCKFKIGNHFVILRGTTVIASLVAGLFWFSKPVCQCHPPLHPQLSFGSRERPLNRFVHFPKGDWLWDLHFRASCDAFRNTLSTKQNNNQVAMPTDLANCWGNVLIISMAIVHLMVGVLCWLCNKDQHGCHQHSLKISHWRTVEFLKQWTQRNKNRPFCIIQSATVLSWVLGHKLNFVFFDLEAANSQNLNLWQNNQLWQRFF